MSAILLLVGRAMFGSLAGQIVSAVAIGALALWGYGAYERQEGAKEGAAEVVDSVNHQAAEEVKAAVEARQPALAPGALQRLRKSHCGDCQ